MFNGKQHKLHSNVVRGAVIGRVSTDEQAEKTSLDTQIKGCLDMAHRFG